MDPFKHLEMIYTMYLLQVKLQALIYMYTVFTTVLAIANIAPIDVYFLLTTN